MYKVFSDAAGIIKQMTNNLARRGTIKFYITNHYGTQRIPTTPPQPFTAKHGKQLPNAVGLAWLRFASFGSSFGGTRELPAKRRPPHACREHMPCPLTTCIKLFFIVGHYHATRLKEMVHKNAVCA